MAKLIEIATRIQDLYEQNYTSNDRFLDIQDFKFWVASTYSAMLNALMQSERKINRQIEGFANIEIPAQWLLEETTTIKHLESENKYYAELQNPVFTFDFDNFSYALQDLYGVGCNGECPYRKISLSEVRYLKITPPVSISFFNLNNAKEIVFWGAKEGSKVKVKYVPQVVGTDDNCLLSDNIVSAISDEVLKRMFSAKNGNMVDKINDQNSSDVPQQAVNTSLGK